MKYRIWINRKDNDPLIMIDDVNEKDFEMFGTTEPIKQYAEQWLRQHLLWEEGHSIGAVSFKEVPNERLTCNECNKNLEGRAGWPTIYILDLAEARFCSAACQDRFWGRVKAAEDTAGEEA